MINQERDYFNSFAKNQCPVCGESPTFWVDVGAVLFHLCNGCMVGWPAGWGAGPGIEDCFAPTVSRLEASVLCRYRIFSVRAVTEAARRFQHADQVAAELLGGDDE